MATSVATTKTLLLVFDNPTQLVVFRLILQRNLGVVILEAKDVDAAQKIIADSRPDLMILSAWIGEASGLEFTRLLRGKPHHRTFPIIMISYPQDADEAKTAGVNVILTPPVDQHERVRVGQSLLGLTQ